MGHTIDLNYRGIYTSFFSATGLHRVYLCVSRDSPNAMEEKVPVPGLHGRVLGPGPGRADPLLKTTQAHGVVFTLPCTQDALLGQLLVRDHKTEVMF